MMNSLFAPVDSVASDEMCRVTHEFDFACKRAGEFSFRRVDGSQKGQWEKATLSIDDDAFNALNGCAPDALGADLIEVVAAIRWADRLSSRAPKGDRTGLCWPRHIKIRLPVRCLERWSEGAVKQKLELYLFKNSGDYWELEFVELEETRKVSDSQTLTLPDLGQEKMWAKGIPSNLSVVLWSGGIDSTGGLAHQSRLHPDKQFLLVSVEANPFINARQKDIVRALPPDIQDRVSTVRLGVHLEASKELKQKCGESATYKTLRTRALLFLSVAALAARHVGQDRFYVYENGIGAFNLSFDSSQVQGQANRAVHPQSLSLFGEFLTALFRQPMTIENPFLFQTKAALCQALDNKDWSHLIPLTFTCGHPQRVADKGIIHCGACGSCLLRRQGFRAANMSSDDTTEYLFDPSIFGTGQQLSKKHEEWFKMGTQFRRIKSSLVGQFPDDWKKLCAEFPELREIGRLNNVTFEGHLLAPTQLQMGILRLLGCYVKEGIELTSPAIQNLTGGQDKVLSEVFDSAAQKAA